jgi:hypothetical protein
MKYKIIVDTKGLLLDQMGNSLIELEKRFCSGKSAKKHIDKTFFKLRQILKEIEFDIVKE